MATEHIENDVEVIDPNETEQDVDLPVNEDGDYVVNLNQDQDAVQKQEATEVSLGEQTGDGEEVAEEVRESEDKSEEPEGEEAVELGQVSEETEEDTEKEEEKEEDPNDHRFNVDDIASEPKIDELPEGWSKMINFLKDNPGASPEDYISVTKGSDAFPDDVIVKNSLAKEAGLDPVEDAEEVDFLYDDKFGFDEELDSERDVKLKKIAYKKALKQGKTEFDENKEKYAGELKFKSTTPESSKADKLLKEREIQDAKVKERRIAFEKKTDDLFNDKFKGFEFKYGEDKSQTIKVGDLSKVKENQSNLENFLEKFTNKSGYIDDAAGYHKALWAANNVDKLFDHAYNQGKADAVREAAKKSKNIDMGPRTEASPETASHGYKLLDDDSDQPFRFNI